MLESSGRNDRIWSTVVGTTVGVAASAATLLWTAKRRDGTSAGPQLEQTHTERAVRGALRSEDGLSRRGILVSEMGPGIVELAGIVRNEEEMDQAVQLAQAVDGVRTVVNRLTPRDLEAHLAETRERFANGDTALHETHWTGMNVGMGRRRQSPDTDPDRPDDHAKLLERELRPERVADEALPDEVEGDMGTPRAREELAAKPEPVEKRIEEEPQA